jgi:hypothetical protein
MFEEKKKHSIQTEAELCFLYTLLIFNENREKKRSKINIINRKFFTNKLFSFLFFYENLIIIF